MAKVLDILRKAYLNAPNSGTAEPPAPTVALGPPEPEEEVPFIEVGGKHTATEASPGVLASVPAPSAKGAPARQDSGPRFVPLPTPEPASPPALKVAFRAVPPAQRFAPEIVAYHEPGSDAARQYSALAETLEDNNPDDHVLLFAPIAEGVGATTVVLNLAVTIARRGGVRVAVIDANLENPSVAEWFGLAPGKGLRDVLLGSVMLHLALRETGMPNLSALTAGDGREGDGRGAGETFVSLVRQLRERFDVVLIDAPACQKAADLAGLAVVCDGVYAVVPEGEAESARTAAFVKDLMRQRVALRGQILTER